MSQDSVFKALGDILMADGLSYGIVGALTLIVFAVMWVMLPLRRLAVAFAPAIFWGGLVGIYAASACGVIVSKDKSANIVATSVVGMIAALLVMVLLARLVDAALRIRKPLAVPTPVPVPRRVRI